MRTSPLIKIHQFVSRVSGIDEFHCTPRYLDVLTCAIGGGGGGGGGTDSLRA